MFRAPFSEVLLIPGVPKSGDTQWKFPYWIALSRQWYFAFHARFSKTGVVQWRKFKIEFCEIKGVSEGMYKIPMTFN